MTKDEEDSIIISRVQRAPERKVFYIDVGDMPKEQIMDHLDKVKVDYDIKRSS